jgi:hypothetical protein
MFHVEHKHERELLFAFAGVRLWILIGLLSLDARRGRAAEALPAGAVGAAKRATLDLKLRAGTSTAAL